MKIVYALKNKDGEYLRLGLDGTHYFNKVSLEELDDYYLFYQKDDAEFVMYNIADLTLETIKITYEVING